MLCRACWPLSREADKAEEWISREEKAGEASIAYFIALAIVVCCSHTECFTEIHPLINSSAPEYLLCQKCDSRTPVPQTQEASSPGRNAEGAG